MDADLPVVPEEVLQTIAMESANQDPIGQAMVAKVILNRARITGSGLKDVVFKPKQFSAWNDPKWSKAWLEKHYTPEVRQSAMQAFNVALRMNMYNNVTHYHTKSVHPKWSKGHKPVVKSGDHLFFGDID